MYPYGYFFQELHVQNLFLLTRLVLIEQKIQFLFCACESVWHKESEIKLTHIYPHSHPSQGSRVFSLVGPVKVCVVAAVRFVEFSSASLWWLDSLAEG